MSIELDETHVSRIDLDSEEQPLPVLPGPGIAGYRKAIVAVVGAVVAVAAAFGLDVDPTLSQAIITIAMAILVYAVPNEQPVVWDDQGRERLDA